MREPVIRSARDDRGYYDADRKSAVGRAIFKLASPDSIWVMSSNYHASKFEAVARISGMLHSPQLFQLIQTGGASPEVGEDMGELNIRRPLGEFHQDCAPGTVDALRIRKVFVHYPVKRVEQFFFQIHSARPGRTWSPRLPCCPQQNPTIRDRCR